MKNLKQNLLIGLNLFLFVILGMLSTADAQTNSQQLPKNPENYSPRRDITLEQQQDNSIRQRQTALRNVEATIARNDAVPASASVKTLPNAEARRQEELENINITKAMLRPPAAYYEKFAEVLKNKNMNLARLFADKNCDQGKTISVQELERCGDKMIAVKGGGSYYSFRLETNTSSRGDWWDIHFTDNKFAVGTDTVQTIISEIGTVNLSDVNSNSKALEFLKNYSPKRNLSEIREQNKVLQKGINFNNFTYSNLVPVKPD